MRWTGQALVQEQPWLLCRQHQVLVSFGESEVALDVALSGLGVLQRALRVALALVQA